MFRNPNRLAVYALCVLSLTPGMARMATAGIVPTTAVVEGSERSANLLRVERALSGERVRQQLAELGVAPGDIDQRLAGLSNAELASLADRVEQAPAGGEFLALVGVAFVVLLVLELVGVIDFFKSIGPVSSR